MPDAAYAERRDRFQTEAARLQGIERYLAPARLVSFLAAVVLLLFGWLAESGNAWWFAGGGIALAAFVGLIVYNETVRLARVRAEELAQINGQCLARLRYHWDGLPEPKVELPREARALAFDLDLFGHASLFQLINVASTSVGLAMLRDWLIHPAEPDEIRSRQQAVRVLAPLRDLREELLLEARQLAASRHAIENFLQWVEGGSWLRRRPVLRWACRMLPLVLIGVAVATFTGAVPNAVGGFSILGLLVVNFWISVLFQASVHDIFTRVATRKGEARRYLRMFELLYGLPEGNSKLDRIRQSVAERGGGVMAGMRSLNWIAEAAGISHSPLFYVPVYLPLQLFALYDFHVLDLLEGWQSREAPHVRPWFEALGEFEALSSLGLLAHDHPDWVFPVVAPSTDTLAATALGHPLIDGAARVPNDVAVGPQGTLLLVTGSNMSGKSTLLRSLGVNIVLAQTGAPVCARQMSMPPVVLATSMRVRDSLEDGVSFYMAELMRLKQIVDLAIQSESQPRRLFYLLDEILQGTNSRERHVAVVRVLTHLLKHGAIGAVSTHDLELAGHSQLSTCCQVVHFRETLHSSDAERPMTFDYVLRPGVATTTNALKLLEIVGLGEE